MQLYLPKGLPSPSSDCLAQDATAASQTLMEPSLHLRVIVQSLTISHFILQSLVNPIFSFEFNTKSPKLCSTPCLSFRVLEDSIAYIYHVEWKVLTTHMKLLDELPYCCLALYEWTPEKKLMDSRLALTMYYIIRVLCH